MFLLSHYIDSENVLGEKLSDCVTNHQATYSLRNQKLHPSDWSVVKKTVQRWRKLIAEFLSVMSS